MKKDEPIFHAADVSAYVWVDAKLVYSSLPLYGESGIYMYDPRMETVSCLVSGKDNDYFELSSFLPKRNRIEYYYSNDINHLDVAQLKRSKEALRELALPLGN